MYYSNYIIHYNQNHSKSNGQFISGDGDGDGIVNDHANQRKANARRAAERSAKKRKAAAITGVVAGLAVVGGLTAASLIKDYREKVVKEKYSTAAADFIERQQQTLYREAAAKAKFVGGDW